MPAEALAQKRKRWDAVLDRIPDDQPMTGIEVGVWRAILSRELLAARPFLRLHLVDPWQTGKPGTPWWGSGSVMPARSQVEYERAYRRTIEVIDPWRERAIVHRTTSALLADDWSEPLDFAFIDGDHSFEGCSIDIAGWIPHVRAGGWIGGHDWDKPERGQVTAAVLSFFDRDRIEVDSESTWFVDLEPNDIPRPT